MPQPEELACGRLIKRCPAVYPTQRCINSDPGSIFPARIRNTSLHNAQPVVRPSFPRQLHAIIHAMHLRPPGINLPLKYTGLSKGRKVGQLSCAWLWTRDQLSRWNRARGANDMITSAGCFTTMRLLMSLRMTSIYCLRFLFSWKHLGFSLRQHRGDSRDQLIPSNLIYEQRRSNDNRHT